jgi:hypothetical protein
MLPIELRTTVSVQLYVSDVSDSGMEAKENMRCCIVAGVDSKFVTTIHQVLIQVNPFLEMFLRAGEFIVRVHPVTGRKGS